MSNSAPSVLLGLNGSETRPTQPSGTPSFTADRGARVAVPTRARVLLSVLPGMDGSETRPHTTIRDPSLHTGRIAGEGPFDSAQGRSAPHDADRFPPWRKMDFLGHVDFACSALTI